MSPKKLSPNNLTSTQLGLLSAAAQREDGAIELAPNLKGGAADKVVGKLLRDGLIEESRRAARYRSGAVTRRRKRSRCASPRAALRPSGSINIAHYWRLKKIAAPGGQPILHATSLPVGPLQCVARKPVTRLRKSRPSPAGQTRSRLKCSRCSIGNRARPSRPSCRQPTGSPTRSACAPSS